MKIYVICSYCNGSVNIPDNQYNRIIQSNEFICDKCRTTSGFYKEEDMTDESTIEITMKCMLSTIRGLYILLDSQKEDISKIDTMKALLKEAYKLEERHYNMLNEKDKTIEEIKLILFDIDPEFAPIENFIHKMNNKLNEIQCLGHEYRNIGSPVEGISPKYGYCKSNFEDYK